ncbi:MAG: PQQ-dependent sugar dehydrogenase [Solirubrobacterales bacterium]
MLRRTVAIALLATLTLGAGQARALSLEPVGRFDQPTYVISDPSDPNRLFVSEREGKIQLLTGGLAHTFVDLNSKVECKGSCQGERGLMSVAPAPDFASSGHLFVQYANDETGTIHVDELTAALPGRETASLATLAPVFSVPHSQQANHNGGQLQFGPDGMLYSSTGDGGGGNDELHTAQNPASLLGKILRVAPQPGASPSIWSLGLRNPFRFSFDRGSGDMLIGDVGQVAREEIDMARSPGPGQVGGGGANYGWNCREGFLGGPATDEGCGGSSASDFVAPVFDYPHAKEADVPGGGGRCAVIGGYVVRDQALGDLFGRYLYADLCSGAIRSLRLPAAGEAVAGDDCWTGLKVSSPVSFGEDAASRVYVVTQAGEVLRLSGQPPASCPPPVPDGSGGGATPAPSGSAGSGGAATGSGGSSASDGGKRGGIAGRQRPATLSLTASRDPGDPAAVTVTAKLKPCAGRSGELVKLRRGGRPNGSAKLGPGCTSHFERHLRHRSTFRAMVAAGDGSPATVAAPLRIVPPLTGRR